MGCTSNLRRRSADGVQAAATGEALKNIFIYGHEETGDALSTHQDSLTAWPDLEQPSALTQALHPRLTRPAGGVVGERGGVDQQAGVPEGDGAAIAAHVVQERGLQHGQVGVVRVHGAGCARARRVRV